MKRLHTGLFLLSAACLLGSASGHAQQGRGPKANCELRLVSNAGAGEAFMAIFTRSEAECLSKSDPSVEAKFRRANGAGVAKRGGAGPQR